MHAALPGLYSSHCVLSVGERERERERKRERVFCCIGLPYDQEGTETLLEKLALRSLLWAVDGGTL